MSPPQIIKRIAQSPATRTTREIATRIISLAVYDELVSRTAHAAETSGRRENAISIEKKVMGSE
jgi:hypothetical protein